MEKKDVGRVLQDHLRQGEQVLWQGKTETFPLLENDAKTQILGKWIGTCVAIVTLLTLYLNNAGANASTTMIVIVLVIAVVLLVSPVVERNSILGQAYWITNQRVFLISKDRSVYFLELSEIDEYQVVSGKTEYDSLVLSSCIYEDMKHQLRWRACHPKMASQGGATQGAAQGLVLFNLKNCAEAEALLRQQVKKADAR